MMENKPIFEYSDLELKAIGFDIMEQIDKLQKNLSLLQIEMSRRRSSKVLSSTTEQGLSKMFSETSQTNTDNPTIDVGLADNSNDLLTPLNK